MFFLPSFFLPLALCSSFLPYSFLKNQSQAYANLFNGPQQILAAAGIEPGPLETDFEAKALPLSQLAEARKQIETFFFNGGARLGTSLITYYYKDHSTKYF